MDVGRAGVEQRPLFETLAREELDLLHVVAVVGPDIESAAYVSETAERLADQIEALKPKGMQVVEARIWSPRRDPRVDGVLSAPDGFFTPRVDANLVIIPEDRRTEATLGVPLTDPHSDAFASHVAAEVATALGMWSGMDEAPVGIPGQRSHRLRPGQGTPDPLVCPGRGDPGSHPRRRRQPRRHGAGAQRLLRGALPP